MKHCKTDPCTLALLERSKVFVGIYMVENEEVGTWLRYSICTAGWAV
jgi:hypothetical protein